MLSPQGRDLLGLFTTWEKLMIIVRDIIAHAGVRKLEWLMAGLYVHLGYVLFLPYKTFEASPAFSHIATYFSENEWATIFLVFGLVRLVVLVLNGTHIKTSAEIRLVLSACSFAIFTLWVWGIDAANVASTGGATYKWLALGELMNVWQSRTDIIKRRSAPDHATRNTRMG